MPTTAMSKPGTTVDDLSEALAAVFRTGEVGDVFTDDVFLDGHPPFWRFQIEGLEAFEAWLRDYTAHRPEVSVVRTVRTATGFFTEQTTREQIDGEGEITSRKVLICAVRDGRVSELCVYCSGDWNAELRARHAAEAPILRPS